MKEIKDDLLKYTQISFGKKCKSNSITEEQLCQNKKVLHQSDIHQRGKKMNFDLNFSPYIEINLKGVIDLNAKLKNYKTQKKTWRTFGIQCQGKCFFVLFCLWLHPRHMKIPGPGIKSEPQLQPTSQLQQCQIL